MRKKVGKALVVGAGISGIRSALDLAEVGYDVILIDRSPHITGILSQLDYQFPNNRCGMCKMLPLVDRDSSSQYCLRKGLFHENIKIRLSTELVSVEGEAGHFKVLLRQKPNLINPDLCIGCGECVKVCPVEVADSFNAGMTTRKAVYLPVPHNIPNAYVIDLAACNHCGKCEPACPVDAIQISKKINKDFRILVVDDELILRDSIKEWLEDEGFAVDMAESGPKALDLLSKQTYQLMLTDIKMPGMDGVELLQKAKENFPDLCVVMMTAYATVETAVEAMKMGAVDYLIKPFDPDKLIPMVFKIYEELTAVKEPEIEVGAIVLCGGTSYFDPSSGKNTYGYGIYPDVVTGLEFERILSGTGPSHGRLTRPSDGKPIGKVAWLQCIGSRDIQMDADFCSSICCMHAIKEALIAKDKAEVNLEAAIFYMDMRTFGKSFQRYRERAETVSGVRFERGRVHSVILDKKSGNLLINYVDYSGQSKEEAFDMVVLSVGQRPALKTTDIADMLDIPLNQWGFCQTEPFSLTKTGREGIVSGGSFSGLKDISESVIQASAAALSASRVIHAAGGSLVPEITAEKQLPDIFKDPPKILVVICSCGDMLSKLVDTQQLVRHLDSDPAVDSVVFSERTCTAEGWENLVDLVEKNNPNRVLIGACLPYVYVRKIRTLSEQVGLDHTLINVVDIKVIAQSAKLKAQTLSSDEISIVQNELASILRMGIAGLKWADPTPVSSVQICRKALVAGGGIAGMTAALGIADHGFEVDIVEKQKVPGGNLNWLQRTLEGYAIKTILDEIMLKVEKHPLIRLHTDSRISGSFGQVGRFYTTVESKTEGAFTLEHGVTILATGGMEAATTSYHYGESKNIITQKELEGKIDVLFADSDGPGTVVMIQCVDSRQEPRNYCSRVCCATALKHALYLKEKKPDTAIYILYRDMMTYGFYESFYTRARRAGVIFIPYNVAEKPEVIVMDNSAQVTTFEPIVGKQIQINADLVVLATGIVPALDRDLAQAFGVSMDQDGFFEEAESKFRPVDSLKEGVFACGLAHSPRNIAESLTTAEAASQRALRILSHKQMPTGKVVAQVHHSLCCQCERCIDACPYGARILDLDLEKVIVNAAMCQGCGSCATVCPNSASILSGFLDQQMFEVIDSALEGTG